MLDVAVIGGGPAGSTAAALLARAGRKVAVFEREKFPRFHIGESLLPFSMETFERLGVLPKLEAAGFLRKYGAEIASGCGKSEMRFYFKDGFRSKRETAFQVERAQFDKILLDHARECGADVQEETDVQAVDLAGGDPVLTIQAADGARSVRQAAYVLDCSGRQTLLATSLALKSPYDNLRKFAIYAHYEDAVQPPGIDGTLTRMVRAPDHWFWIIPLSATKISVGVVMDAKRFRAMKQSPEEVLEACLREHPIMRSRLLGARRVTKVFASGDYSYRNSRLHGPRWLLAGDAAGFIDPIFSSGVFLAILSGERAADALHGALSRPADAPRLFARYERHLGRVMGLYLRFVRSWYRREFVETLLSPQEFLHLVPAVNAVLAGNTGQSFPLRWRLWIFYLIVKIQRAFPICPRLSLSAENG